MSYIQVLVVLVGVVAVGCVNVPCCTDSGVGAVGAPGREVAVSEWTEPVEGVRFRVSMLTRVYADDPLHIIIWMQNVSDHEIYVFRPGSGPDTVLLVSACAVAGDKKEYWLGICYDRTDNPSVGVLDYYLLRAGEVCAGEYRLGLGSSAGSYQIGFCVQIPPSPQKLGMEEEVAERISSKLWHPDIGCVSTSLLPLEIVARPLDWYVEKIGSGWDIVLEDTERKLVEARTLPKAERLRLLERLKTFEAEGADPYVIYHAMAATGMPEAVAYLMKTGAEAATQAASEADKLTDQAYYIVSDILSAFEECPNEAALPFLLQMLKHSRPSVRGDAVGALAAMPKPEFAGMFRRFLFDEEVGYWTHVKAAKGLARIGDEEAYDVIHQALVYYEKAGEDEGSLLIMSEAYDELTRILQALRPDFKPPEFVERDKEHLREKQS